MYIQWGFTANGIELLYCSHHSNNIDFNRDDVYTVYVETKENNINHFS